MDIGGDEVMFLHSEKAKELIGKQPPMDKTVVRRVKEALLRKGVVLDQSDEIDRYLIEYGFEAVTYSEGTIIMHTDVSASGFYEELIHLGQIKSGKTIQENKENNLLMEIEAQERLIKHQKAYGITDFEIEVLKNNCDMYRNELIKLRGGEYV